MQFSHTLNEVGRVAGRLGALGVLKRRRPALTQLRLVGLWRLNQRLRNVDLLQSCIWRFFTPGEWI